VLAFLIAPTKLIGVSFLAAYMLLRTLVAWTVGVWGVRDDTVRRKLWLIPLRDAANFIVWIAGLFGDRVVWSGVQYVVHRGRMSPIS
jgi:hypothetical protein